MSLPKIGNEMFSKQIRRMTEVYVDDMLVKSRKVVDHIRDLSEMFDVLQKHMMKLNPLKCSFGVSSCNFIEFMANTRGIMGNPE